METNVKNKVVLFKVLHLKEQVSYTCKNIENYAKYRKLWFTENFYQLDYV